MSPQNEAKREALKRWYLDNNKTMIDFTRDVFECRNMNAFADIERTIEHMHSEWVNLGLIKVHTSGR